MKLYLIRHAETTWKKDKRIKGHKDIPLSTVGKKQAVDLARYLELIAVDEVWSSDLSRCLQTIEPFVTNNEILFHIDPKLREKHFWNFQWVSTYWWEEEDRQNMHAHPSVEPRSDLVDRIEEFYDNVILSQLYEDKVCVVVTHSWPLMILVALLFKKKQLYLDWLFQMFVWNATVSCFEVVDWIRHQAFVDMSVE